MSRNDCTNGYPSQWDVKKRPDLIQPEMRIFITHFVSPQLFWYIELKDLEANSKVVREIERKLPSHCHEKNQLTSYGQGQKVIVWFLACKPPKLIRGEVRQSKDQNYLVSALDYGFTINCLGGNLWLLPENLQQKCLAIKEGSVASVIPLDGSNWSKTGLKIFDQKLEDASELFFIPLFTNLGPTDGLLFWKSGGNKEMNAASFLVENEYACLDTKASMLMRLQSTNLTGDIFDISLAELNKRGTEPRLRVRNIIQIISEKSDPNRTNSKGILNNGNHQFNKLLSLRSFNIPQSALKISKVNRNIGSSNYGILTAPSGSSSQTFPSINDDMVSLEKSAGSPTKLLQNLLKESPQELPLSLAKNKGNFPTSHASSGSSKTILQSTYCIPLAHSVQPIAPLKDMGSTPFCPNIEKAMKGLHIHTVFPTQLFAWPHLMRQPGNSLLLIDGPDTGRTWCYLPALCSLVMESMKIINTNYVRVGPVAIILTDLNTASKLVNVCVTLMQAFYTRIQKVVNSCSYSQANQCSLLLDSCGIFITTPDRLNNLLEIHCKKGLKLFDSNCLKFFVCDDYDGLRLSNPKLLIQVIEKFCEVLKCRFGLIMVAQQWHPKIFSRLIKNFAASSLILFGDYLQASMYGGLRLETVIRSTSKKLEQLLIYLTQKPLKRTVIYCKNRQELQHLVVELTRKDYHCIGMSEAEKQETYQLLLVSDELPHLVHLAKKNIEVLIHYSMPESWTRFTHRFHSMMDSIPNLLVPTANLNKIVTYFILDQSNHHQMSRLMQFFDAHGIELDKSIRQGIANYQEEIVRTKPFCPYLLSNGECNRKQECNKRHHLLQSDVERRPQCPMQQSGTVVRCKVNAVYDPVHIAIWPLEFKPEVSSKWQHAPHSISHLGMELAMSMATKSQPHHPINIGDICVMQHQGQFKRVRIIDLPNNRLVAVQLMDFGTEMLKVESTDLFECEVNLQTLPPISMDIRLTRVCPAGGQSVKWTSEATKWVSKSLRDLNDSQIVQITVDFAMLGVVYASEIAVIEKCRTISTFVYKLKLRKELISKGYGQLEEHIEHELHKNYATQEPDPNINEKNEKIVDPKSNENYEQLEKAITETTPNTSATNSDTKLANTNTVTLMMNTIQNFLDKKNSGQKQPTEEEPPVLPSSFQFVNSLIGQLNDTSSFGNKGSALQLVHEILGEDISTPPLKNIGKKFPKNASSTCGTPEIVELLADRLADSLKCAKISNGAVCPNVKWRQSLYQIDLDFEQQVPQYQLLHKGNTIVYTAEHATPPQCCVLNLLGEVKILSEQQYGYHLHIKLSKLNVPIYWPTLLNSLYAQQHFHWLTYDTDRAQSPPLPIAHSLWQRYLNRDLCQATAEHDEDQEYHSYSSEDQTEIDTERCEPDITKCYQDI